MKPMDALKLYIILKFDFFRNQTYYSVQCVLKIKEMTTYCSEILIFFLEILS